jgi:TolB-like protein/DNA-binding SARP family transcriptional activator
MVEFSILGGVRLRAADGREVDTLLAQPKRLALLAYLTLARAPGLIRRDTLLALFWPEHDQKSARHALSQALHFLRRALGADVIMSRGADEVGLDIQHIQCDVIEFERALEADDADAALSLYRGELLAGFHLSEAPDFERWLDGERARLQARASAAAHERAESAMSEGKKREALTWAQRAVTLDPLNERAIRRLMRAADAAGDRSAALRAYQKFAKRTAADLDAEPAPETRALAETVRAREEVATLSSADFPRTVIAAPAAASADLALPPSRASTKRVYRVTAAVAALAVVVGGASVALSDPEVLPSDSIVVLPFADMGAARSDEYLVDGLTEDLTTILSKVQGLDVAARTSAFAFKGKGIDVREIGRRLGVNMALEGSARRDGDRIRVTAQLVSAKTGYHIWSETYDRPIADVFALQDEIARAVAGTLHLRGNGAGAPGRSRPRTLEAYEAYLRGRQLLRDQGHARTLRAIEFFQRAIAADSAYARAHAGLADAYIALAEFTVPRPILPKAKEAALHAVRLDSTVVESRLALGDLLLIHDRDWSAAERQYKEALHLDDRSIAARQRYSRFLVASGRYDEHLRHAKAAIELQRAQTSDPIAFSAQEHVNLASAYFSARQYDLALDHCRRALALDPQHWNANAVLGRTYIEVGRYSEAIAVLNRAWPASLRWPALARLGYAYGRAGESAEAQRVLRQLQTHADTSYLPKDQIALVLLGLGDREGAISSLRQAYEEQHWWMPWINTAPPFDTLRTDPRFLELLRLIGVLRTGR